MRIVSFLPSATEILFALGLKKHVVGVTFECDFPPAARDKPKVVHSHLPPGLTPGEIDRIVRAEGAEGRSLYFADMQLLEELRPDLILLQDLCRVCAIDSPTLARDVSRLPSQPCLLSLSAGTLEGVLEDIERVGAAANASSAAGEVTASLRARIAQVSALAPLPTRPRVLALEWLEPFFQGGHWVPEMIALAGGEPLLAEPGAKSRILSLQEIERADPDLIVVMPCGYDLPGTVAQYRGMCWPAAWQALRAVQNGNVFAVNGSAFFSRPGPRLVEGIELLSTLLRAQPGDYVRLA